VALEGKEFVGQMKNNQLSEEDIMVRKVNHTSSGTLMFIAELGL
jgi:hypothetical protein